MRRLAMWMVALMMAIPTLAQRAMTGRVVDENKEAIPMATVKLLRTDSTLVEGALTAENGNFTISDVKEGKYILKVTSIGFKDYTKSVTLAKEKDWAMGTVSLSPSSIMLKETVAKGHAAKVYLKEDTFIYNAAAYRTPEGSVVEELIKKLPGAQVDDEGNVTINGKEVKKILVEGKEFMTGDTKTALKNLPTSIVDKVKSYDEKSDLARVSGIDDGEEQTVLDFGLKPGMNKGMFTNNDVAYGTEDRYAARLMGAYMNSDLRVIALLNANNVNDMGFSGGGGRFGGGRQGLNASKMAGVNVNYEKKDVIKVDGSVRWNHSDGDAVTKTSSENFVSTEGSFSNSLSRSHSRSNSWNAQMRIEWTPDTMTNIMFRPTASISSSDSWSKSSSATYSEDPYDYVTNPLDEADALDEAGIMVNDNDSKSLSYSDSKSIGGTLQVNRKLSTTGRNVTVRVSANYGDSDSKSLSTRDVHLYQTLNEAGLDSTYQTNRYNVTPSENWNYSIKATYSEPIFTKVYLQFSYEFQYKYTKSDRATYDFSDLGEGYFDGATLAYRKWNNYLGLLDNPYTDYLDDDLSRSSEYQNYIHDIQLMLRVIRTDWNFNVGVTVMPQKTHFKQNYLGVKTDTTRTVTNVTPTMDFRWKISKVSQLRFNYRGSTSQPSMSDLLDITDDSDPLNVTMGNPGLKPSFTNRFFLRYNNYIEHRQQAMGANLSFSTTSNSISNRVTYDSETGGRTTRPENINGNWDMSGSVFYNLSIDTAGYFNVNTTTDASYNHNVGYIALDETSDSEKNITKVLSLKERLATSYRNDWFEFEITGSLNYNYARNKLQPSSDLDTWQFSYGFNTNMTLPWGTGLSTDLNMNSRRGYNDASMNTNELIWNLQLSQSFLSGKPLTITLQFYDILREQSTISRAINSMSRTDTEYNAIASYAMVHVIYRLNQFGNKEARQAMRDERRMTRDRDRGGQGGPPDGGAGGGPGGGGPGGGGPGGGGGGFGGPGM